MARLNSTKPREGGAHPAYPNLAGRDRGRLPQHWAKLRVSSTQLSPRATPSARNATPEGASNARRAWQFELRGEATRRGLNQSYVERCWRPRTWHFELSSPAARQGLSRCGEVNLPSALS